MSKAWFINVKRYNNGVSLMPLVNVTKVGEIISKTSTSVLSKVSEYELMDQASITDYHFTKGDRVIIRVPTHFASTTPDTFELELPESNTIVDIRKRITDTVTNISIKDASRISCPFCGNLTYELSSDRNTLGFCININCFGTEDPNTLISKYCEKMAVFDQTTSREMMVKMISSCVEPDKPFPSFTEVMMKLSRQSKALVKEHHEQNGDQTWDIYNLMLASLVQRMKKMTIFQFMTMAIPLTFHADVVSCIDGISPTFIEFFAQGYQKMLQEKLGQNNASLSKIITDIVLNNTSMISVISNAWVTT